MSQLTVPDATYQRLARRAASMNLTVEEFVTPILEQAAEAPAGHEVPEQEWKNRFDELLALARRRASRYPAGFQADVSRESIYERCGE